MIPGDDQDVPWDEIVRRWCQDGFGVPTPRDGSFTALDYELRAWSICPHCKSTLVGTKSGSAYSFTCCEDAPEGSGNNRIIPFGNTVGPGTYEVAGCMHCGLYGGRAWRGDDKGTLTWHEETRGGVFAHPGKSRITNAAVWARDGQFTVLIAARDGALTLVRASDVVTRALPFHARWLISEPLADLEDNQVARSLLISGEGRMALLVAPVNGEPAIILVPNALPAPPVALAGHYRGGRLDLVVATGEQIVGLHLDPDGRLSPIALPDLREQHITHIQRLPIFGRERLLAMASDGRVWSTAWPNEGQYTGEVWHEWPRFPTEVQLMMPDPTAQTETSRVGRLTAVLRDHDLWDLEVYNRKHLKHRITAEWKKPKETQARASEPDQERYTYLTGVANSLELRGLKQYASAGGHRTLEGLLRWLESRPPVAQDSVLSPSEAVEIGIDLLLACEGLSHADVAKIGGRLHDALRRWKRFWPGGSTTDSNVETKMFDAFLQFLQKYYVLGWTYGGKHRHLRKLCRGNKEQQIDALIYLARLQIAQFDVLYERIEQSGVAAIDVLAGQKGAGKQIAVTCGDGAVWMVTVPDRSGDQEPLEDGPPEIQILQQGDRAEHWYSRVVRWRHPGGTVMAIPRGLRAPKGSAKPGEFFLVESTEYVGAHPYEPSERSIYSALRLHDGWLLGTSSVSTPLLWASPVPGASHFEIQTVEIESDRGKRQHPAPGGVRRRVWGLVAHATEKHATIYWGAEDGRLRIGIITQGKSPKFELRAEELFLGAGVRSMVAFRTICGPERRFIAVGLKDGNLLICENIRREQEAPEIVVKSRAFLNAEIRSLFVDEQSSAGRLFALDASGYLTVFATCAKEGSFLGQRLFRGRVADWPATAAWLGDGRLAIGEWNGSLQVGRFRIISLLTNKYLEEPDGPGTILAHARKQLDDTLGVDDEHRALRLLRTIPTGHPSLRAFLSGPLLELEIADFESEAKQLPPKKRVEQGKQLVARWATAAQTRLEDHTEITALFHALAAQLDARRGDGIFTEMVVEGLRVEGRYRLKRPLFDDPLVRAEFVRSLFGIPLLRNWRTQPAVLDSQGKHPMSGLEDWVHTFLTDPSLLVRLETTRCMSEALFALIREAKTAWIEPRVRSTDNDTRPRLRGANEEDAARIFGWAQAGDPLRPHIGGVGWLLRPFTLYLRTHRTPEEAKDWELEISVWSSVSVVLNLLRLFPEAAIVILDHLSVNGVDDSIHEFLRTRLRSPLDSIWLREKLLFYNPLIADKGIVEVIDGLPVRESENKNAIADYVKQYSGKLFINQPDPDHHYLNAQAHVYAVLRSFAEAYSPTQIEDILARTSAPQIHILDPEPWATEIWEARTYFYQVTVGWLRDLFEGNDNEDNPETRLERFKQSAERSLLVPERQIVAEIFRSWQQVLTQSLPETGQSIGKWKLAQRAYGSSSLFYVTSLESAVYVKPKESGVLLATPKHWLSPTQTDAVFNVWRELKSKFDEHKSRTIEVMQVLKGQGVPALVMREIKDGKTLLDEWPALKKNESLHHAARLLDDLIYQLNLLAKIQCVHGDLAARNIIVGPPGEFGVRSFYLVDFENLRRIGEPGRNAMLSARMTTTSAEHRELMTCLNLVVLLALGRELSDNTPLDDLARVLNARDGGLRGWPKHLLEWANKQGELDISEIREGLMKGRVQEWLSPLDRIRCMMSGGSRSPLERAGDVTRAACDPPSTLERLIRQLFTKEFRSQKAPTEYTADTLLNELTHQFGPDKWFDVWWAALREVFPEFKNLKPEHVGFPQGVTWTPS